MTTQMIFSLERGERLRRWLMTSEKGKTIIKSVRLKTQVQECYVNYDSHSKY